MASDRQLYHIERENGVLFGLKWSLVGCLIALCFLSSCSLFDSGTPRYNSVVGEKRVPVLNPGGVGFGATDMAKNQTAQTQMMQNQSVVQNYQQPIPAQQEPVSGEAAALFAANQQQHMQQAQMQAAPPVAQQPMAPTTPMMAQPESTYPQLPPSGPAPQPTGDDAAIQAEIDALERDMASSKAQRQQMATQEKDDSWLPNLGVSSWFGGDEAPAAAPSSQPLAPQAAASPYAPVQLPPPPLAPGAAPMPPVIQEPYQPPLAGELAATSAPQSQSIDVPLAPIAASSAPTNVPTSLIPPGATLSPSSGYLQDSRYSSRRNYSRP